jgi:hypothetical protein
MAAHTWRGHLNEPVVVLGPPSSEGKRVVVYSDSFRLRGAFVRIIDSD